MPVTCTFKQATNWINISDTEGWWLFTDKDPDSYSLALVMGCLHEPWPKALYRCRGGYAGSISITNSRDYFVVSINLKGTLNCFESFISRQFFVIGLRKEVEQVARRLADKCMIVKKQWASENVTSMSNGMYPVPLPDSKPIFYIETPDKKSIKTDDPYIFATTIPAKNPLPSDHPLFHKCEGLTLITSYAPSGTVWRFLGFKK